MFLYIGTETLEVKCYTVLKSKCCINEVTAQLWGFPWLANLAYGPKTAVGLQPTITTWTQSQSGPGRSGYHVDSLTG